MSQFLSAVTLVVTDYDEAIAFYCHSLGFDLIEDTQLSEHKRWVRVRPPSLVSSEYKCDILLAKASNKQQRSAIGQQAGGRVAFSKN